MKWLLSILALLMTLACGKPGKRTENADPSAELRARYEEYLAMGKYGWEAHNGDCDSLLFASLSAVAHNQQFDIEAARAPDGQWFRVPVDQFPSLGCSSTISRDMLMGVMVYALHFKRLDLIQDLGQYGRDHNWKMGTDSKLDNRTFFTPSTIALLYRIEHYLGGKDYLARHTAIATPTEPGYQSHLGMLQLYILGKVDGELDGEDKADLEQILQHCIGCAILIAFNDRINQLRYCVRDTVFLLSPFSRPCLKRMTLNVESVSFSKQRMCLILEH